MSLENLVDNLGQRTDRGKFLRRAAAVGLGVAGAALGFAPRAAAGPCSGGLYYYQGCCLVYPPDPNCSCNNPWCWSACPNCLTGEKWHCCECPGCSYAHLYDYSCTKCQKPAAAAA